MSIVGSQPIKKLTATEQRKLESENAALRRRNRELEREKETMSRRFERELLTQIRREREVSSDQLVDVRKCLERQLDIARDQMTDVRERLERRIDIAQDKNVRLTTDLLNERCARQEADAEVGRLEAEVQQLTAALNAAGVGSPVGERMGR